jgi:hypothetical protein
MEEVERVSSLAKLCINVRSSITLLSVPEFNPLCLPQVIGKHINDVEAFGNIGNINMDNIAVALARNRSL